MAAESNQPEVGVLTSKVVQINAVSIVQEGWSPHVLLYALCEDGSVWEQSQLDRKPYNLWRMVQPPIEAVQKAIWAGNEIMETAAEPQVQCPFEVGDIIIFSNPKGTLSKEWRVEEVHENYFIRAEVDGDEWNKVYSCDWPNYKIVRKGD